MYAIITSSFFTENNRKWLVSFSTKQSKFKNIAYYASSSMTWQKYSYESKESLKNCWDNMGNTITKLRKNDIYSIKIIDENSPKYKEIFLDCLKG